MSRAVYASRETSHFLLGTARWWQDDIRADLKAPGFLRPAVDAFLLYDQIVLDPGPVPDGDPFREVAGWGEAFRELVEEGALVLAPFDPERQRQLHTEALDDLCKCLTLVPPDLLRAWARRFQYDYLLESPWWLFIREMDQTTLAVVRDLQGTFPDAWQSLRGVLPFLYSALCGLKASALLGLPALVSQVEFALRDAFLEVGVTRPLRERWPTEASARLEAIARDVSERFAVPVPSFYDICQTDAPNRLAILTRAARLRKDPDCRWFRQRFWEVISEAEVTPDSPARWQSELTELTDKLTRRTRGRILGPIRRLVLEVRQCGPVSYLLGSVPLHALAQRLGQFLLDASGTARQRRALGWRYFLLKYAELPTAIPGNRATAAGPRPDMTEAEWNAEEQASLARLVRPTAPTVEALLDAARAEIGSGLHALSADELAALVYGRLQRRFVYDYEPFSPAIPQRVRLAEGLLRSASPAAATCLDLALLYAGCLEAAHGRPLVFHLVHRAGDAHAVAGYWTAPGEPCGAVLDGEAATRAVGAGDVALVETTGLCQDAHRALTFAEAKARGTALANDPLWTVSFALDLTAARRAGLMPAAPAPAV